MATESAPPEMEAGAVPPEQRQPKVGPTTNASFRFQGPSPHWQQYGLCFIFHLLLPLLPIGTERLIRGHVAPSTVFLVGALYSIAIGVSSRHWLLFGYTIAVMIGFLIAHGDALRAEVAAHAVSGERPATTEHGSMLWPFIGIATVFLFHALERYNRHVADREPFLDLGWGAKK